MPKKVDIHTDAMVLTLYRATNNISEIGRKVGLHRHTVRKILDRRGVLEDSTIKALKTEAERLRRMKKKREAYHKYRSQMEVRKLELSGDEMDEEGPSSVHKFLEPSKDNARARTTVINVLRELERLAPDSFRNICRDEWFGYDDILEMMWGSGKMVKDAGRLLTRLSRYLDEFFVVGCKNIGISEFELPKLVERAEEEEYFYGKR